MIPFRFRRKIVTAKPEIPEQRCVGCLFQTWDASGDCEDLCVIFTRDLTGITCHEKNIIFIFEKQWVPCPIDVKEGTSVRHIHTKQEFKVIFPPINRGIKWPPDIRKVESFPS